MNSASNCQDKLGRYEVFEGVPEANIVWAQAPVGQYNVRIKHTEGAGSAYTASIFGAIIAAY